MESAGRRSAVTNDCIARGMDSSQTLVVLAAVFVAVQNAKVFISATDGI